MNKQVLRILEIYIRTQIFVCMYMCVFVYIYGIFILKIVSKYLPVG